MSKKNNISILEYSVDYRTEEAKNNIPIEFKSENSNELKKSDVNCEYIDLDSKISSSYRRNMCSRRLPLVSKRQKISKFRIVLASLILILVIISVATVVTIADPNFILDMSF